MRKKLLLYTVLALAMQVAVAHAGSVLHLGTPPNSGTYLYGSEVRPIDETNLGILENGNGQPELVDPLLLILGVANMTDLDFTAPTVDLTSGTGSVGGSSFFSGTWDAATGYGGYFTAASTGDVYSFLGLSPSGNNSNNFGNWAAAELFVNGITASGFGIFVYELVGTGISGGNTVDVEFSSALDPGTFVVAYGQDVRGRSFTTPFTESGLTQQVPEPGVFLLFGTGLFGIGLMRRKFKKT